MRNCVWATLIIFATGSACGPSNHWYWLSMSRFSTPSGEKVNLWRFSNKTGCVKMPQFWLVFDLRQIKISGRFNLVCLFGVGQFIYFFIPWCSIDPGGNSWTLWACLILFLDFLAECMRLFRNLHIDCRFCRTDFDIGSINLRQQFYPTGLRCFGLFNNAAKRTNPSRLHFKDQFLLWKINRFTVCYNYSYPKLKWSQVQVVTCCLIASVKLVNHPKHSTKWIASGAFMTNPSTK